MASASRVFENDWQTQPRTILSTARNGTRLGLPRRSTMICCRNARISASNTSGEGWEQIDDNPKNYSAEIQHPAEDHPILRLTPTG